MIKPRIYVLVGRDGRPLAWSESYCDLLTDCESAGLTVRLATDAEHSTRPLLVD